MSTYEITAQHAKTGTTRTVDETGNGYVAAFDKVREALVAELGASRVVLVRCQRLDPDEAHARARARYFASIGKVPPT